MTLQASLPALAQLTALTQLDLLNNIHLGACSEQLSKLLIQPHDSVNQSSAPPPLPQQQQHSLPSHSTPSSSSNLPPLPALKSLSSRISPSTYPLTHEPPSHSLPSLPSHHQQQQHPLLSSMHPASPSKLALSPSTPLTLFPHNPLPLPRLPLRSLSLGSVVGMASHVLPGDELLGLLPPLGHTLQVRVEVCLGEYCLFSSSEWSVIEWGVCGV